MINFVLIDSRPIKAPVRVLVVDDVPDCADSLSLLLIASGYDVTVAYDGMKAIAAAREFLPDVCVVDICMPYLDGFGVVKEIKYFHSSCRFIALTGYSTDERYGLRSPAGFDGFLIKPIDPNHLINFLDSIFPSELEGSRVSPPLPTEIGCLVLATDTE